MIVTRPARRRTTRRAGAAGLVVALLALAPAACGDGGASTLDPDATTKAVQEAAASELPRAPSEVTCPDEIPKREGAAVTCTATVPGLGKVRLRVVQPDDTGRLEVARADAIVRTDEVAVAARAALSKQLGRDVTVVCSTPRPVVVRPGGLLVCRADDGSSTRTVRVTVVDAAGSLRYQLVQ